MTLSVYIYNLSMLIIMFYHKTLHVYIIIDIYSFLLSDCNSYVMFTVKNIN